MSSWDTGPAASEDRVSPRLLSVVLSPSSYRYGLPLRDMGSIVVYLNFSFDLTDLISNPSSYLKYWPQT